MVEFLYDDSLAPITSEFGFLECEAKTAANEFYQWQSQIHSKYKKRNLEFEDIVCTSLKYTLEFLLPLRRGDHTKHLFIPTLNNRWVGCFDNGWQGTDATTLISVLAEKIGCRGVRVAWSPNTIKKAPNTKRGWKGRYGAVIFDVFGPKPNPILNYLRTVELINDGKWDFITGGEPFDFEETERYELPRKTDRFTPEMLDSYLKHLGIDAFSEDFYLTTKENPAKLISLKGDLGYEVKEYTLEQARENY